MTDYTREDHQIVLRELAKRKLDLYRPYKKQIEFHNASAKYREVLMMASNQCVTPWTFIETVSGLRPSSEVFFEKDVNVLSWDGEFECASQISSGFLKGIEPAFRLVMEDGAFFDCSSQHQLLCEQGYLTLDSFVSQTNALRSTQTVLDFRANCEKHGYLCDRQLPFAEDIDQGLPPSSGDARVQDLCWSHEDAEERIHKCNYAAYIHDRELFASDKSLREALFSQFSGSFSPKPLLSLSDPILYYLRSDLSSSLHRQTSLYLALKPLDAHEQKQQMLLFYDNLNALLGCDKIALDYLQSVFAQPPVQSLQQLHRDERSISILYPLSHPSLVGGKKIATIIPIGLHPIVDCHIPNVNNYKAAGVYHHNSGKTYCAAAMTAMHATGKYFDWYTGIRFKRAPVIWCAGVTGEVVRDSIQRLLIGDVANPGTGLIPESCIIEKIPSRGVADLIDTILVKHSSGETTRIRLKYYEQGREKFQADTVNFVWLDEEPDEDIYKEALTRTNATGGYLIMTFTPLKGMSKVVKRFVKESSPDRCVVSMTIEDALHISAENRQKIINSYAKHEREARIYGKPIPGSGQIFPVSREDISCEPFDMDSVPFFWMELAGIDFAGSGEDGHPTAAVRVLYNPQDDIVYVTNTYRRKGGTPMVHGSALRSWGGVAFAWPHDGLQHDRGSGIPLKDLYAKEGLKMLPENAKFEDGGNGVEAGIAMLLIRMETGKLKIFSHLHDLFDEISSYYRNDGKVIKVDEDLICSLRYTVMCLRFAARVNKSPGAVTQESGSNSYKDPYANYHPFSRENARKVGMGKK